MKFKTLFLIGFVSIMSAGQTTFGAQFCNGTATHDSWGKPLYPNGKPALDSWDKPLYPNGKPALDSWDKPLYPNGKPALDSWDKPLYPNGKPVFDSWGTLLYPNGRAYGSTSEQKVRVASLEDSGLLILDVNLRSQKIEKLNFQSNQPSLILFYTFDLNNKKLQDITALCLE